MADINIVVNEENKPQVWENEQTRYTYETNGIYTNIEQMLSNSNYSSVGKFGDFGSRPEALEDDDEADVLKGVKGWEKIADRNAGAVYSVNRQFELHGDIYNGQYVGIIKQNRDRLRRSLIKESKDRSEPRLKRHYADMADVIDDKKGNYTKMVFTSPYMGALSSCFVNLNNPSKTPSKVEKEVLTVPLFNASYDFLHSVSDEIRIHYEGQKLEENKNATEQDKRKYLSGIKKTHEQFIKSYENLNTFVDDPQGRISDRFGNSLAEVYGRGKDKLRHVNGYAGMVIGEKKAIENGWNQNELAVLSAIGCIDENIKKYEKYGSAAHKEGLSQFKADFYKLKMECYNARVDSARRRYIP